MKASGGVVKKDTPYIVGEEGPELFVPKEYGEIIPAKETKRILEGLTVTKESMELSGSVDVTRSNYSNMGYNVNVNNPSRQDKLGIEVWLSPDLESRIIDKTLDEAAGVVVDIVNRRK